jgi:hypothetical protein
MVNKFGITFSIRLAIRAAGSAWRAGLGNRLGFVGVPYTLLVTKPQALVGHSFRAQAVVKPPRGRENRLQELVNSSYSPISGAQEFQEAQAFEPARLAYT